MAVAAMLAATAIAASTAACVSSSTTPKSTSSGSSSSAVLTSSSSAVLTMESSPQNTITDDFNPFIPSSAVTLLGATSLVYEPLLQFDVAKPPVYYKWLATGYKWSKSGKSITFTIRSGVKWSNGKAFTPADVVFTYLLLKRNPGINTTGLPITSASSSGSDVTVNFASAQFSNLQNVTSVYIVPKAIWNSVGNPGRYLDSNPIGSGPYTLTSFTTGGFTMQANAQYWGGKPKVGKVAVPVYASNNTVLSALEANQLDWAGNFLSGLQSTFVAPDPTHHKVWFAPVNTNAYFPNLKVWPTNQLAVRKAISLALNRTAISTQGEAGLEPVATNASGLVLPNFKSLLAPSVKSMTLSPTGNPAAAKQVLKQAGFVIGSDGFFHSSSGQLLALTITDPASYTDYAEDGTIAAADLQKAGIDATFNGQSVSAWSADIADGNFQLSQHWSVSSISAYQLYNNWLNSALATSNAAGDFERLNNSTMDQDLAKLASDTTQSEQLKDLAPIEKYVATQLPVIPTVYGAAFDEYNTSHFTGWPSASNPYESGTPNALTNEVIVLRLRPVR